MSLIRRHPGWTDAITFPSYLIAPDLAFYGTPKRDFLLGTPADDTFDMSQGGNDHVRGFGGDDTVYFGAAFTGADRVSGGKGFDTVTLDGDYSAGVDVQANSLTKIETLALEGGSYVITGELNFKDDLGRTYVDGRALTTDQGLHLSVTSLGALVVQAGAGDDVLDASSQTSNNGGSLFGFSGEDMLIGGAGSYVLVGGSGADRIVSNSDETQIAYLDTLESTPKDFDTIERFQGKLRFTFDSDTSTVERDNDFHFGKTADRTGDILVKSDAGADETIVKVFTDADHKADFVLHLTGDAPLTAADFIFG